MVCKLIKLIKDVILFRLTTVLCAIWVILYLIAEWLHGPLHLGSQQVIISQTQLSYSVNLALCVSVGLFWMALQFWRTPHYLVCFFVLFRGDKVDEAAKRGTCVSNPTSVLHKFLSHLPNTFSELEMD